MTRSLGPRRRFAIAVVFIIVGAVIYLTGSGGPGRVHRVAVPFHSVLLLSACAAAWAGSLTVRARFLTLCVLTVIGSVLGVYLSSLVIMALRPLHWHYFLIRLPATAVEVAVFLGAVWLVDRAIALLRGERVASRP